jgi:hypothetical protein
VLAGYGVTRIVDRLGHRRVARRAVVVGLGVLMLAEYASKPLELATVRTSAPETYADIERDRGDSPTAALFEYPPLLFHDPTHGITRRFTGRTW